MIRVLYAEDDPNLAETVEIHFSRYGTDSTLVIVDSGLGCLEAMQRGGFDVLLLDLVMPDLDGLSVLGQLTARHDPTPVIMVSGHGQAELAVRALRAGAVDCIDKNSPDFRRICEIVRRVHVRHQRRLAAGVPPRDYRVLLLDTDHPERGTIAGFFSAQTSRLHLSTAGPAGLEQALRTDPPPDAVVLGPGLGMIAMYDALRQLRSISDEIPVVVLSSHREGETAITAFQLGAHDYLLYEKDCLTELVFSLQSALQRAETDRLNARLSAELAALNRSLADQVAERTRDLQAQILVRQAAEHSAELHAARSQALAKRLLRVQEDERHAIARELHDQIGQLLTGLRFQLEAARTNPAALAEAFTVTDELLHSVRELTLQLRPRMLDDFGLRPALEWHVERFRRQTGIAIELDVTLPDRRLANEIETTAYRLVQEALTNVARHSGAAAAVITVAADEHALQVEVSERGRGFDMVAALAKPTSLGLAGLTERVQLAGGQLEISSQPGKGTRLHAEFPLAVPAAGSLAP